jgi:AcrR family transcriptional regulator
MSMSTNENSGAEPVHNKGRKRRALVVAAARTRLIEHGITGLVLRDLADEMGITHGNLQYYFKTKNDLLKAVFDEEVQKYTVGLTEGVKGATTTAGKISAIIDSCFAVIETDETRLWRMLIALAGHDLEFAEILKQENQFFDKVLAGELAHIAPHLSKTKRKHIATLVRVMIDGVAVSFTYNEPSSPENAALKSEIKAVITHLLIPR